MIERNRDLERIVINHLHGAEVTDLRAFIL